MTLRPVSLRRFFEPLLGLGLAGAAELEAALEGILHTPLQALLVAVIALPVALRFEVPLLAVALTGAAYAALETQVDDGGRFLSPAIVLLLSLYAVGSRLAPWRVVAGALIGGIGLGAGIVIREGFTDDVAFAVLVAVMGVLIGRAAGVLQLETEVLEERANLLEQERDEHTRAAIRDERNRIARELHDVIGHSISVMGLQAGAVRSVLPAGADQERAALLAVERTGREAVGEMHRLIGLLRPDDAAAGGPSPSLARIEGLAEDMRRAGQRLELDVCGDVAHLPAGVDLAGFRIVQEALTNALKHAPGAWVRASVRLEGRTLELEVVDGGGATSGRGHGRVGHGLVGMRERAVLYGGHVTAGPQPAGGFRVHAALPVEAG